MPEFSEEKVINCSDLRNVLFSGFFFEKFHEKFNGGNLSLKFIRLDIIGLKTFSISFKLFIRSIKNVNLQSIEKKFYVKHFKNSF